MPVHDWTKVSAGTWHAFHLSWNSEIQEALNGGLLPTDYYAQAEQFVGHLGPDVLTLRTEHDHGSGFNGTYLGDTGKGGTVLLTKPPKARFTAEAELDQYAAKRRFIAIRHTSDDEVIAVIELVSPGNKSSQQNIQTFVDKAVEIIYRGYHLLIVDLFPPTRRDPDGLPALIWSEFADKPYELPVDERLTLSAYDAGQPKKLYVETTAVGKTLVDMPLFLEPGRHIQLPLEATYTAAYRGVPRKWQQVLGT